MYSPGLSIGIQIHVRRSRRSFQYLSVAGCAALLYVVLVVLGSSCTLSYGDVSQSHHQHHGDDGSSAANPFCAWACQAAADAVAEVSPSLAAGDLVIGPVECSSAGLILSTRSSAMHSRAPPSSFFVRLT